MKAIALCLTATLFFMGAIGCQKNDAETDVVSENEKTENRSHSATKPKYADPSDPIFPFKQSREAQDAKEPAQAYLTVPPSTRAKFDQTIQTFGENMDPEVHSTLFKTLQRLVKISKEKKVYVLENPIYQSIVEAERIPIRAENYDEAMEVFGNLVNSEISTRDGVMSFDAMKFLSRTAGPAFKQMDTWEQSDSDSDSEKPKRSYEVLNREKESATVKVTVKYPPSEFDEEGREYENEEEVILVDGQWVEKEDYERTEKQFPKMQEWAENFSIDDEKDDILEALQKVNAVLDTIEAADSQEKFDEALQAAVVDVPTVLAPLGPVLLPKLEGSPFMGTAVEEPARDGTDFPIEEIEKDFEEDAEVEGE